MALADEVESRYGEGFLIPLTNPGKPEAVAVDDTRLGLAATDVIADFEIYAGVVFSLTDAKHVNVGVEGVIVKLMMRTGQINLVEGNKYWAEKLEDLAKVQARDRIIASSESQLVPTPDDPHGTGNVKPWSDRANLVDFMPGNLSGSLGTSDTED